MEDSGTQIPDDPAHFFAHILHKARNHIYLFFLFWLPIILLLCCSGENGSEPSLNSSSSVSNCKTIRFADVGWTDITATTAVASVVLESLGYECTTQILSVPVTYTSLKNGDIDIFLGNWMPAQEDKIKQYLADGSVEVVRTNLEGAKYTLAVPRYVAEAGLKDFADIQTFQDKLDGKLYGIEPGNQGNRMIHQMIEQNAFNLKEFELVESSEQGMLSQVERSVRRNDWIVFLGWAPHPMNTHFDMTYLSGGDDWFGAKYGGSTVFTIVRTGFLQECPNVGKLLKNLYFTLPMENAIMDLILNEAEQPESAAKKWLTNNPEIVSEWLEGVTTINGDNSLAAIRESL